MLLFLCWGRLLPYLDLGHNSMNPSYMAMANAHPDNTSCQRTWLALLYSKTVKSGSTVILMGHPETGTAECGLLG